ncbi:TPA: hypothetical protein HA242_06090 [Candidatus Woesearchaeota archaeon]|nr:hypothetical protein [Candidatus Woesearchaeota archaeon]HIH13266.1 hypothetical protein [Candidatus Woesearchaeota archaeon]
MEDFEDIDIEPVKSKHFNISCCRSYLTPKGRCYSCPEMEMEEPDE